jgi:hypothetical protein
MTDSSKATELPSPGIGLQHGRTVSVVLAEQAGCEILEIRSAAGDLELAIELTPAGPRLRIRAVDIEIGAADTLRMTCAHAELHASETIELRAHKDIVLRSERGRAAIHANDDVDVKGERILLNADAQPMAASYDAFRALVDEHAPKPGEPERP